LSNNAFPVPTRIKGRIDGGLIVLLALSGLLLLAVLWAVSLRSDADNATDQIGTLEAEIDLLRSQANATAYNLAPSADAPPNALGTAFFSLDGTGVLSVSNLAPAPDGRSYQVWYYPTADAEPIPGSTLAIDEHGSGFTLIPADVGVFTTITITLEPLAGSTSPTGPVILTGTTGGARG
jgi:hypothetical protein